MARSVLAPLLALLLAHCGAAPTSSPAADAAAVDPLDAASAAAPDATAIVDAPADDAARDAGAAPVSFPAFTPPAPAVVSRGGPVLAHPRLVPVFVVDPTSGVDPQVAQVEPWLAAYASSQAWRAQLDEYGVGPGTVAPSVRVAPTGLSAGMVPSARLVQWMLAQIDAGAWGDFDEDTLFLLMLDASRQVQLGASRTCEGVGGYHSDVHGPAGQRIAYAVIPDCSQGLDSLTRVLSHEIVEAATDPYPNFAPAFTEPATDSPPEGAWSIAYTGGEVGDMCEQRSDAAYRPAELEHDLQRSWSNRAAAAGLDPCVPAPDGALYFNAVPTLPETLMIPGRDGRSTVAARGVVVPAGVRRVVDVRLFSSAPSAVSMRVAVREVGARGTAPAFRYALDRATGVNGDVLHLTITATSEAPEGRVFQVVATLNGFNNNWVGAAATGE